MILLAALVLLVGVACGGDEAAEDVADEHADMDHSADAEAEEETGDSGPRVFFANVSEGDEVTSPVSLEFGIEGFEIVAAQDPIVIEDGKGHHHLAINAHCKPTGEVIEKAEPWIHFGDGSNTIDVQLPLGSVHLSLQIGDGEHRTLDEEGLCAMINLTVVESESSE